MSQSVKLSNGNYIDAEGVWDATQGKSQSALNAITEHIPSGVLEEYNFPISQEQANAGTSANYSIKNDGLAVLVYGFSDEVYSQFNLAINGIWLKRTITSGNQALPGLGGSIIFPVRKGMCISIGFYQAYTMSVIHLRVI